MQLLPCHEEASLEEDLGAFALRPSALPEAAHTCFFGLTASEGADAEQTSTGFLMVREAQVRLASGPHEPHFWRYCQNAPNDAANVWFCAMMYRGPHGSWRFEPLNLKFMAMALGERGVDEAEAMADAAEALAWRLRWLPKDRSWKSACEERGIDKPPGGA